MLLIAKDGENGAKLVAKPLDIGAKTLTWKQCTKYKATETLVLVKKRSETDIKVFGHTVQSKGIPFD